VVTVQAVYDRVVAALEDKGLTPHQIVKLPQDDEVAVYVFAPGRQPARFVRLGCRANLIVVLRSSNEDGPWQDVRELEIDQVEQAVELADAFLKGPKW
jgi:hypothetical protein